MTPAPIPSTPQPAPQAPIESRMRPTGPGIVLPVETAPGAAEHRPCLSLPPTTPGVLITRLAELPAQALLDEAALADALGVTKRTVRRMVGRHELPPPVQFAGRSTWQAGAILRRFEALADQAAKAADRRAAALQRHMPLTNRNP